MKAKTDIPQTELHRHLDVSARTTTLLELAQDAGLEAQSTSLEAFKEKVFIKTQHSDLTSVLSKFTLFQKVLTSPEKIERLGFEAIEDCHAEGTRQVELRYSPSFVSEYNGLNWDEALDAFERGIQRGLAKFPGMKAGMLIIASRDFGPDAAARSVEFYLKNRHRLIGMDLAGPEAEYPATLFEEAFRPLKQAIDSGDDSVHVTVHAGEGAGPESMWQAIESLGAQRIGHGIRCVEDPALMRLLAEKRICLEVCPTSNWVTKTVEHLGDHPLPRILEAGIPASINTDDPGIFDLTLPHEYQVCREQLGMSDDQIRLCQRHAYEASFI